MEYEQLNLFKQIEEKRNVKIYKSVDIYKSIEKEIDKFGVDSYYEKTFRDKTCTFKEISEKLYELKDYKQYLNELYVELKKYYREVVDDYKFGKRGIAKRENVIIVYSEKSIGPIYCLKMMKSIIQKEEI